MTPIKSRPTQGYFMVPAKGSPSHDGHILGGSQSIAGAVSPNSGKPLLQLAQLNTDDRRLELETAKFASLPLLYSWTCDIHRSPFTYRVEPDRVELLSFQEGRTYTDFPYENYPEAFAPVPMNLAPVGAKDRHAASDEPQHQLGGTPTLMQDVEPDLKCPGCAGEMPLFAAIANDNGTPPGFTDNPYVQVVYHLCRECWVITCYNMCD
jgi:hypothetical protein